MEDQERISSTQKINIVYAAEVASFGIKIGIANDAARRRNELRNGTKKRIEYIYIAKCIGEHAAAAIEKQAHALLWDKRIKGEWFAADREEAVGAIKKAARQLRYKIIDMPLPTEKRIGRPPGQRFSETIPVRLEPEVQAAVDEWGQANDVSRSEAIRRLLRSHPDLKRYLGDGK